MYRMDYILTILIIISFMGSPIDGGSENDQPESPSGNYNTLNEILENNPVQVARDFLVAQKADSGDDLANMKVAGKTAESLSALVEILASFADIRLLATVANEGRSFSCTIREYDQLTRARNSIVKRTSEREFSGKSRDLLLNRMIVKVCDRWVAKCSEKVNEDILKYADVDPETLPSKERAWINRFSRPVRKFFL